MNTKRKPRLSFAQRLAQKFKEMGVGTVDSGMLGDKSASWVNMKIGDTTIEFAFDSRGEKIHRVGLYKDKIEIVDQIKIWGN